MQLAELLQSVLQVNSKKVWKITEAAYADEEMFLNVIINVIFRSR